MSTQVLVWIIVYLTLAAFEFGVIVADDDLYPKLSLKSLIACALLWPFLIVAGLAMRLTRKKHSADAP